jgi:hypothetical protein
MGNTKSKIPVKKKKISLRKRYIKPYPINNDAITVKYVGYGQYNEKKCNNEPKYSYIYNGVRGGWYV